MDVVCYGYAALYSVHSTHDAYCGHLYVQMQVCVIRHVQKRILRMCVHGTGAQPSAVPGTAGGCAACMFARTGPMCIRALPPLRPSSVCEDGPRPPPRRKLLPTGGSFQRPKAATRETARVRSRAEAGALPRAATRCHAPVSSPPLPLPRPALDADSSHDKTSTNSNRGRQQGTGSWDTGQQEGRTRMVVRTYEQECAFVKQVDGTSYSIGKGFVDNMNVPGHFYVNQDIKSLLFDELRQYSRQVPGLARGARRARVRAVLRAQGAGGRGG